MREGIRMSLHTAGPPAFDKVVLRAALIASAAAAAIHLGAAHSHLSEYAPAGGFMIVAGVAQAAWALSLIEPTRALMRIGIAGNGIIIALWIVSRTVGLPFGPAPWTPEDIHTTDVLATGLEVVVLFCCSALVRPFSAGVTRLLQGLAFAGAALSPFASAHEPAWERAVTAAGLLAITTLTGIAAVFDRIPEASTSGREHVEVANDRGPRSVFDGGAWPTVGAGGL